MDISQMHCISIFSLDVTKLEMEGYFFTSFELKSQAGALNIDLEPFFPLTQHHVFRETLSMKFQLQIC